MYYFIPLLNINTLKLIVQNILINTLYVFIGNLLDDVDVYHPGNALYNVNASVMLWVLQ